MQKRFRIFIGGYRLTLAVISVWITKEKVTTTAQEGHGGCVTGKSSQDKRMEVHLRGISGMKFMGFLQLM